MPAGKRDETWKDPMGSFLQIENSSVHLSENIIQGVKYSGLSRPI
jgi:hypothetical protein